MFRLRRVVPSAIRRRVRRLAGAVRARRAWNRMLREVESGADPLAPVEADHVCLLAWYFPPEVTGGTYRPAALVRHGVAAGYRFTVIAAPLRRPPSDAGRHLVQQLPETAVVIRAEPSEPEPPRRALPELDGGASNVLASWRAIRQAFQAARPGVVLATGPPFHTFVTARLAAAHFRVPLVLEYRDEWTECPFDFVRPGRDDRRWEARCLSAAHRVVFTTESQMEHHLRLFPELERERAVVIPNGWEPEDAPSPDDTGAVASIAKRPCAIAFAGYLGDHTPPDSFLGCLSEAVRRRPELAGRFVFQFIGQRSRKARLDLEGFGVEGMIRSLDQVTRRESGRMLRASCGLLLLNPPMLARYIPGKLYEYLAADRPILVYGDGGEVAALVRRLNAGPIVRDGDVDGLTAALEAIAGQPEPAPTPGPRRAWLADHTREALAGRMVEVLESVAADQSRADPTT